MKHVKVFLSGSVRKGDQDRRPPTHYWSEHDESKLYELVTDVKLELLNPNRVEIDRALSLDRFIEDIDMLLASDVVIVDARTRKGLGVGAEMMLARSRNIPVLVLCPHDSEYRKGGAIHAFVVGLSSKIFGSLADLAREIELLIKEGSIPRPETNREGIDAICEGCGKARVTRSDPE